MLNAAGCPGSGFVKIRELVPVVLVEEVSFCVQEIVLVVHSSDREYDRNFKILEEHKSEDTPGWIGWGTVLHQWGKVYV